MRLPVPFRLDDTTPPALLDEIRTDPVEALKLLSRTHHTCWRYVCAELIGQLVALDVVGGYDAFRAGPYQWWSATMTAILRDGTMTLNGWDTAHVPPEFIHIGRAKKHMPRMFLAEGIVRILQAAHWGKVLRRIQNGPYTKISFTVAESRMLDRAAAGANWLTHVRPFGLRRHRNIPRFGERVIDAIYRYQAAAAHDDSNHNAFSDLTGIK